MESRNKGVILFDGYCNLCSWVVQFIRHRDRKGLFRFIPLQSDAAMAFQLDRAKDVSQPDSVVFIQNGSVLYQSAAIIAIMRSLGGFYNVFVLFLIFPASIRDFFYRLIARNRYRLFGKRDECSVF